MEDRELLELASKAAGMDYLVWTPGASPIVPAERRINGQMHWNPIHDDGDALRLAVRLEIEIRVFNGAAHAGKQDRSWRTEHWFPDGDIYAATRRAIVRAAAAIGKEE